MPDDVSLSDIEALSVRLSECGIKTLEDLKRCIGTDADSGITWLADNSEVPESLLLAILIAEIGDDPSKKDDRNLLHYWRPLKSFLAVLSQSKTNQKGRLSGWNISVVRQLLIRFRRRLPNLRTNWPDLVVFTVLPVILAGLALRAYSINKKIEPYVRVKAAADLPIFHRITDEIEMVTAPNPKGSLKSLEDASSRYTLTPVAAGAPLTDNELLSRDLSNKTQNRQIMFLPLKAGSYDPNLQIPCEAVLILSPRQPNPETMKPIFFEIIILRIANSADSKVATIALSANSSELAATLLASHEIFLAKAAP